ncbi:heparinase II/III family protein [Candidatus Latescibacterota bacterium]
MLPSLERVFNIDLSAELDSTYLETVWAGTIKDKKGFYFGDSGPGFHPLSNFAWLLDKYHDPLLGWVYNFLKGPETFEDVLYDTKQVPQEDPFDKNPVRLFREIGTTVFKSGWEKDDFVFVMRTGPFFNHQHYDQGTFWFADRGITFIEERHGSIYDDAPYYRPWYTKPVAHSTILIDGNHQSQRGGDPLDFAEGFHDHAFVGHFLDGTNVSFVSGNIGRLYWGKVKDISRNVLYLKPRTLLMLDVVTPKNRDRDVTLLYQTTYLKDINEGAEVSTITKDDKVLNIYHLTPDQREVTTAKTPHYYHTLRNTKPLVQEGMLTVTARTSGEPLIMANVLTTDINEKSDMSMKKGNGCVSLSIKGNDVVFSTKPQAVYTVNDMVTDALTVTIEGPRTFLALCTVFKVDGELVLKSAEPVTCELFPGGMKYYRNTEGEITVKTSSKPDAVSVNGVKTTGFRYEDNFNALTVNLPAGEGVVMFR